MKNTFTLVILLLFSASQFSYAEQKIISVGSSTEKADLDTNFENIHDNFTSLFNPDSLKIGSTFVAADMEVVSETQYDIEDISDRILGAGAVTYTRNSVKQSIPNGVEYAIDIPAFEPTTYTTLPNVTKFAETAHTISGIGDGREIELLHVDSEGNLWGRNKTTSGAGANGVGLVYNDLSENATTWEQVKVFGAEVMSVQESTAGYVFLGLNDGSVWRTTGAISAITGLSVGDLELVIADMDMSNEITGECKLAQFGTLTSNGSTVWVSQYGENTDVALAGDAAIRVYRSTSNGDTGTWTEVFALINDTGVGYYKSGMHIHGIEFNPTANVLLVYHGDADPNQVWYDVGGDGDNWQTITEGYVYDALQPTSSISIGRKIYLFPDEQHNINGFLELDFSSTSAPTISKAYNFGTFGRLLGNDIDFNNRLYYVYTRPLIYNGAMYIPFRSDGDGSRSVFGGLVAVSTTDLNKHAYVDTYVATAAAVGSYGHKMVGGTAKDGKIYSAFEDSASVYQMMSFSPIAFSTKTGLAMDRSVTNDLDDGFFDSGGWNTIVAPNITATLGCLYGGSCAAIYEDNASYNDTDLGAPSLLSPARITGYVKYVSEGDTSISSSVLLQMEYMNGGAIEQLKNLRPQVKSLAPNNWLRFTGVHPGWSGTTATSTRMVLKRSNSDNTKHHLVDGLMVQHGSGGVYPPDARVHDAGTRAPDKLYTTITAPADNAFVFVSGAVSLTYLRDASTVYTIWEAANAPISPTDFIKIVLKDRDSDGYCDDLVMIDGTGSDVGYIDDAIESNVLVQRDGEMLWWSASFGPSDTTLKVQGGRTTQKTGVAIGSNWDAGLDTIFDGCSHNAGEELDGIIVGRTMLKESTKEVLGFGKYSTSVD